MARRKVRRAAAVPLFEQPAAHVASPLELIQRAGQSARDKARTLISWATLPAEYRRSFPDIPEIEPAYLVQLLEQLERQDVRAAQRDSALLGGPVQAADLAPLLEQARRLAGQQNAAARAGGPAGPGRPDLPPGRADLPPLLDPLETSRIESRPDPAQLRLILDSTEPYEIAPRQASIYTATKRQAETASKCFRGGTDPLEQKRADRIGACSTSWGMKVDRETGEVLASIINRCRDRFCPSCAERRAREVRAWIRGAVGAQLDLWGEMRYAMLTLTTANVPVEQLGAAVDDLRRSFARLTRLKEWPGAGYVAFLEVTRGEDGNAHPHLHVLVALHPEYFHDRGADASYLPWARWVDLWQQSLRVKYRPVLDVRAIRPTARMMRRWRKAGLQLSVSERMAEMCAGAVAEVAKYPMRYDRTLMDDSEWFRLCARELQSKRAWCAGGVFTPTIRAAKVTAEQEKKKKAESDRTRRCVLVWFRWNGWDYIRATPEQERAWSSLYYARQVDAEAYERRRLTRAKPNGATK